MQLRAATLTDVPLVEACVHAAYEQYVDRMSTLPAPMLADYAKLVDGDTVWLLKDEAVDYVAALIVMWPEVDHLFIENIAVDPRHAGHGLAPRLLDYANEVARSRGLGELRLYTNAAMTENLAYYPRNGFVETGRAVDDGYERVYFARPVA